LEKGVPELVKAIRISDFRKGIHVQLPDKRRNVSGFEVLPENLVELGGVADVEGVAVVSPRDTGLALVRSPQSF
jgi:hypothetical protein